MRVNPHYIGHNVSVLTPPPSGSHRQLDLDIGVGWISISSTHAHAHTRRHGELLRLTLSPEEVRLDALDRGRLRPALALEH
jgi:hypothetical protein